MTDTPRHTDKATRRPRLDASAVEPPAMPAAWAPPRTLLERGGDLVDDVIYHVTRINDSLSGWLGDLPLGMRMLVGGVLMAVSWTVIGYRQDQVRATIASHTALQTAIGRAVADAYRNSLNLRHPDLNGRNTEGVGTSTIVEQPGLLHIITEDAAGRRCEARIVLDAPLPHPAGRRCSLTPTQ